jgi:quinol monooxygenase YgiN
MFTRVVECTVKPGKTQEFTTTIREQIIPILRKQTGFVDETLLVSPNNPEETVSISFWRSQEDAERYHRENYSRVLNIVRPLLSEDPQVRPFNVQHSETHKIAAGKAA